MLQDEALEEAEVDCEIAEKKFIAAKRCHDEAERQFGRARAGECIVEYMVKGGDASARQDDHYRERRLHNLLTRIEEEEKAWRIRKEEDTRLAFEEMAKVKVHIQKVEFKLARAGLKNAKHLFKNSHKDAVSALLVEIQHAEAGEHKRAGGVTNAGTKAKKEADAFRAAGDYSQCLESLGHAMACFEDARDDANYDKAVKFRREVLTIVRGAYLDQVQDPSISVDRPEPHALNPEP